MASLTPVGHYVRIDNGYATFANPRSSPAGDDVSKPAIDATRFVAQSVENVGSTWCVTCERRDVRRIRRIQDPGGSSGSELGSASGSRGAHDRGHAAMSHPSQGSRDLGFVSPLRHCLTNHHRLPPGRCERTDLLRRPRSERMRRVDRGQRVMLSPISSKKPTSSPSES